MKDLKKTSIKIISILIVAALIILLTQFIINNKVLDNYSNINFKGAYLDYKGNYVQKTISSFFSLGYINATLFNNFTCNEKINNSFSVWSINKKIIPYISWENKSMNIPIFRGGNSTVTNKNYSNILPVFNNTLIQMIKTNKSLNTNYPIFTINSLGFLIIWFPILGKNQGYGINYYKYILHENNLIEIILINYTYNFTEYKNHFDFFFSNLTVWINENTGIIVNANSAYGDIILSNSYLNTFNSTVFPKFFNLTFLENLIEKNPDFLGVIESIKLISMNINMNSIGKICFNIASIIMCKGLKDTSYQRFSLFHPYIC
ncbi:MAG: hypothetical protein ACP5TO_07405 [Thermoplasmata archaeon]